MVTQVIAPELSDISVSAFYYYGFAGRRMLAIRAPFAMSADGSELIGRHIRAGEQQHVVRGVARQTTGPIHAGEPIGVEIADAEASTGPAS